MAPKCPKIIIVITHAILFMVNLSTFILGIVNLVLRSGDPYKSEYCEQMMEEDSAFL